MKAWRRSGLWLAAAGLAVGGMGSDRALASAGDEERVFRQEALAHAGAVASAYRFLEHHILLEVDGDIEPVRCGFNSRMACVLVDAWREGALLR